MHEHQHTRLIHCTIFNVLYTISSLKSIRAESMKYCKSVALYIAYSHVII